MVSMMVGFSRMELQFGERATKRDVFKIKDRMAMGWGFDRG